MIDPACTNCPANNCLGCPNLLLDDAECDVHPAGCPAEPEPFDPTIACREALGCPMVDPCTLRCHERFLNAEVQANDAWADEENAAAWRRYYDANPGAEEAARASCDPARLAEHEGFDAGASHCACPVSPALRCRPGRCPRATPTPHKGDYGVNPAADPAWVAARDAAGKMTPAEADEYYSTLEAQRTDKTQKSGLQRQMERDLKDAERLEGRGWLIVPPALTEKLFPRGAERSKARFAGDYLGGWVTGTRRLVQGSGNSNPSEKPQVDTENAPASTT